MLTPVQKRMKKAWVTIRKNAIEADETLTPVQKRMKKAWVTIRAKKEKRHQAALKAWETRRRNARAE